MSARPSPLPRPSDEELDLLISRSLDGDLSPEEEQELGKLLLADPVVRARRDRMAALVAELGRVPAPVPPFALATRVSSRVLEKAGGVGLPSGLAGRAPKMGLIFATMAALGVVAAYKILTGGSVLAPVPAEKVAAREAAKAAPADSSREPVQVFFQESSGPKAEAGKPAEVAGAAGVGAPAAPASQAAPVLVAEARPAAPAPGPEAGSRARANEAASKETTSALGREQAKPAAAAGEADRFAPEPLTKTDALASRDERAKDEREAARVAEAVPAAPAPAAPSVPRQAADLDLGVSARGAEAQSAPAPALAAKGGRAAEPKAREESAAPRVVLHDAAAAPAGPGEGVTLGAPSGGKAAWRLSAPPDLSSLPSPVGAHYRVTLDGTGRVVSLRRVSVAPASAAPGVESFLRGLTFLPVPGVPAAGELDVRVSRD